MARKLFTAEIGSMIDCWFDNDCSVVSEVSDFIVSEMKVMRKYLIWKAAAVWMKMSHPHLHCRAIVALSP